MAFHLPFNEGLCSIVHSMLCIVHRLFLHFQYPLLQEGAVTVIDGRDDGWDRQGPLLLSSGRGAGKRYLRIDSNGSLRADGNKDNSDHDSE